MRKLNNKNKLFILLFSLIIIGIVVIFVYSVKISGKNNKGTNVYPLSSNSVVFNDSSFLIDTKQGGNILKNWDNSYYFVGFDDKSYDLGDRTVVYEKASEEIFIFGENHFISENGNVTKNSDQTSISNLNSASFYKLDDRVYLIVAKDIYIHDKTRYASNYLIVNIDKQGNASFLNDVLNFKTINPLKVTFDSYEFDVANEKLVIGKNEIDLKKINGSTNEYIPRKDTITTEDVDMKEFIDAYNKLVNDFSQYANNANINSSGGNSYVNNTIITNGSTSTNNASSVNNKTNISKRVSLRGTISYPTYIDVTYVVTDPEEKYQAVYLLISGSRDGEETSEKVLLDKYETTYRLIGLEPESEYTVSLGYVEVVEESSGKELYDYIEDVIVVRTTPVDTTLTVDRITPGYVNCTFKMSEKYALQSGKLVLYADNREVDVLNINVKQSLSKDGFKAKLKLEEGNVFTVKLEDAIYNEKDVDLDIEAKFTYQSLNISD